MEQARKEQSRKRKILLFVGVLAIAISGLLSYYQNRLLINEVRNHLQSIQTEVGDIRNSIQSIHTEVNDLDQRVSTIESIVYTPTPTLTPTTDFITDPND